MALQSKQAHPQRVAAPEAALTADGYCRVHLHPLRFPRAHRVDWLSRVLYEGSDFVAVNKPWGVQVTDRVDNVLESVVHCVAAVRSLPALPRTSFRLLMPGRLFSLYRLPCGHVLLLHR